MFKKFHPCALSCCSSLMLLDSLDFCVLSPILLEGLNITLRLEGNPWICDCSLSYLRGLQIRMEVRIATQILISVA